MSSLSQQYRPTLHVTGCAWYLHLSSFSFYLSSCPHLFLYPFFFPSSLTSSIRIHASKYAADAKRSRDEEPANMKDHSCEPKNNTNETSAKQNKTTIRIQRSFIHQATKYRYQYQYQYQYNVRNTDYGAPESRCLRSFVERPATDVIQAR